MTVLKNGSMPRMETVARQIKALTKQTEKISNQSPNPGKSLELFKPHMLRQRCMQAAQTFGQW
jgi:hypothetical protein